MSKTNRAFTLVEVLVSVAVLAMLILLVSRLISSTATITTLAHKRMDGDGNARQLLDRIGVDFSQMIKRADLDYFAKNTASPNSPGGAMSGNDQIAFYSNVPGFSSSAPSPISLVAYRINGQNQLERMGKGLLWSGAPSSSAPLVFLPLTISGIWPTATNQTSDSDYELIGSQVFRFEYYYLLNNGSLSTTPWNAGAGHASINGMQDVTAIAVALATIDAKSKVLISNSQLGILAGNLTDFDPSMNPGGLLSQWQFTIDGTSGIPRTALQGVRRYERYFYFSK